LDLQQEKVFQAADLGWDFSTELVVMQTCYLERRHPAQL